MGHFSIRTRFGQYLHRFRQKKKVGATERVGEKETR